MPSGIDPAQPQELYTWSLRHGRKLPDPLHNHMLLWSFDDEHSQVVKDYLEWTEHCERRDKATEKIMKRMQNIERMDKILNLTIMLLMILLMAAFFISGKM